MTLRLDNTVRAADGLRRNFEKLEDWAAQTSVRIDTVSSASTPWSRITGTPTTLAGYGVSVPLDISVGGTGSTSSKSARVALETPKVTVSETEPTDPVSGDLWFNHVAHKAWWYDGSDWYDFSGVIKP